MRLLNLEKVLINWRVLEISVFESSLLFFKSSLYLDYVNKS